MAIVSFEEENEGFAATDVVGEPVPAVRVKVRILSDSNVVWEDTLITNTGIESVCGATEKLLNLALDWAIKNLEYRPTDEDFDRAGWL